MIYLDNAATTQVDPDALAAMLPWLGARFGNASSVHRLGVEAGRALEAAREEVAGALGAAANEVVFTSGGTEANNLAVRGAFAALRRRGDHVVTTQVEHPSVKGPIEALESEGARVTRVAPRPDGTLDPGAVLAACEEKTVLVSVMHVQNETGAVFPVEAIAKGVRARARHAVVHADGVQALGKVAPPGPAVQLYSISGHKLHGPQGTGALVVRGGARVLPMLLGGGQERGLRSGTEPVALLVGLGVACRLAAARCAAFMAGARPLAERLRAGIEALGGLVNSPPDAVPSTLSASFPGAAAEPLLHALEARGVIVSAGSACASKAKARSATLKAMGLDDARIDASLRFSLSRDTTLADVEATLAALAAELSVESRR